MNIIRGEAADAATARAFLDDLPVAIAATLRGEPLDAQTVLQAADALSRELLIPQTLDMLLALGVERRQAEGMVREASEFLSRGYLETKLRRELGEQPFAPRQVEPRVMEQHVPLGVLTHIAAGNAAGLPAFSVLEGLLAGNINLLKLPGHDDGLSTAVLSRLLELEPRLADYVYVFDLPSTDAPAIGKLLAVSDAVAVWGGDFAVSGIRALAPPNVQIIEWGHKLSFAWVTAAGETPDALEAVARDICETEQLLCSSPQCLYYETESFEELQDFAVRFCAALDRVSRQLPPQPLEPAVQAEITALAELTRVEELLAPKKVYCGEGWTVLADMDPALRPSPMFRTVWVKPLTRDTACDTLRPQRGYLQTAGLACATGEHGGLLALLLRCGLCRVMPCGQMASNYAGEPHDGVPALRRYTRTATVRT